ncbi:alpha/beta hydrolase [Rhodococcus pseudokoreensis]|uniref:Alpha/beta hydrolase n=1 Tax=Rhodococcus pseudokoreensis TaxID=2811421 RepID=A0A974W379_9NOCA|nr:alpha/beta hydrolase [Rhodococcus pseudokoreensis]QSE90413.1 alpha/beta hydrolase [Rhodococcus pseudokoreensis]
MSFVLIHGAGMGASCWDPLLPLLEGDTLAVDLPGRGTRRSADPRSVTLADCTAAVVEDVEAANLEDIVLVAHSFAGVTATPAIPALAGRLRHVVFLSAVVPADGTRVLDQIDPDVRAAVEESIQGGVYRQDPVGATAMLCNDMDAEQTGWMIDQLVDDSAALLTESVDLSGLRADIPRTYVRLTKDACYPPELQERSAAVVGGDTVFLESGHMAMVTIPDQVAALLHSLSS